LDGAPLDFEQRKQYLKESPTWLLERSRARMSRLVRIGIAGVRDAGDRAGVGLQLRDEYRESRGQPAGSPYVDSPGPAIHRRGRYGSFLSEPLEDHESPSACVEDRVRRGADRIKLMASGIIDFKRGEVIAPPQFSVEELRAFVAAAGQRQMQTFAHASGAAGVGNVIEAGVTSLEHGFFVTDDQLGRMRDLRVTWAPTFAPVQAQIDSAAEMGWNETIIANLRRIIESHSASLVKAHAMGVPIVAGSDAGSCGVPHGWGLLYELELMERAGLSPLPVLRSATGASASMLDYKEPIGRIATGYRPHFILTSHSPLQSIRNLRKERMVLFDGQALDGDISEDTEGL
jgi:imidazolonepropionase-like amidohydrolase